MAKKIVKKKALKKPAKKKSSAKRPVRKAAAKIEAIPKGTPAVISGFSVPNCSKAIDFLKTVFGAKVLAHMPMPDGTVAHCDLKIGESRIMCGDPMGPGAPQTLRAMFYVKNCDAIFAKALQAGATVKDTLANQFYGDRTGRVIDPCGNEYIIATHIENVSSAEMDRRMKEMMRNAPPTPRETQASAQA